VQYGGQTSFAEKLHRTEDRVAIPSRIRELHQKIALSIQLGPGLWIWTGFA
jgi:hypothetical protein